MRMLIVLMIASPFMAFASGCGNGKPDPRDRPDFVDTSDPSKTSLYTVDDFKKKGRPTKRP